MLPFQPQYTLTKCLHKMIRILYVMMGKSIDFDYKISNNDWLCNT